MVAVVDDGADRAVCEPDRVLALLVIAPEAVEIVLSRAGVRAVRDGTAGP